MMDRAFGFARNVSEEGKINWWPKDSDGELHPLLAQQLSVLIYNGNPLKADFAGDWKKVA